MRNPSRSAALLRQKFGQHNEWLVSDSDEMFYLRANEIEFDYDATTVSIRYLDRSGFRVRQIIEFKEQKGTLRLILMAPGDENIRIEFVPRVKALELKQSVEMARLEKVNTLATDLSRQFINSKVIRASLNEHNGRFAEIVIRVGFKYVAVLSDVAGGLTPETLLSKAFIWLRNLSARKKQRVTECWIIADTKSLSGLRALSACLDTSAAAQISIWRKASEPEQKNRPDLKYVQTEMRLLSNLWGGRLPRLRLLKDKFSTKFANELIKNKSEVVDRIFSSKGETIRYRGLPFARTRMISGEEKVWFGIENARQILNDSNIDEFLDLFGNLECYRNSVAPNKQHDIYRLAPEAWLESEFRRNIKMLDSNLILSPIYNQFRAARDKIDLLALRDDGRLVIIELKVTADRDMVFQAVDYWRKVEAQRKRGVLNALDLFDGKQIANRPVIVYLVAPTLGFHADSDFLANKVSNKIEVFRFDLAENWRSRVKVLKRRKLGMEG